MSQIWALNNSRWALYEALDNRFGGLRRGFVRAAAPANELAQHWLECASQMRRGRRVRGTIRYEEYVRQKQLESRESEAAGLTLVPG